MNKLKKIFSGNSLLLTSIVLLLLLIVFFGVSYVTEIPVSIKDLRITNISDTSVTVTYFTEIPTISSVIVSDKNDFDFLNQLSRTRFYDDRKDGELRYSHHITVSELKPSSTYFFEVMGNFKQVKYDYPVLKTGKTLDTLKTPDPTYGSFSDNTSMDSIVYLSLDGSTLQSTYLGKGNTFSMDKANIRTPDLENQSTYKYHDPISIEIINNETQLTYQTNVGSDQPTVKFVTTINKEPSKVRLNTSVLGSVYAEACSDKTKIGQSCTGPNGYQYTLKDDGKWNEDVAQMQDHAVKTGIPGSTVFTEEAKKQAEKGGDKGPFSPSKPAPIPTNATLPICSEKITVTGTLCRGNDDGLTYEKIANGWNNKIAIEQRADPSKLYSPSKPTDQEGAAAGIGPSEAEKKSLCDSLTLNQDVWTMKDAFTLFNCKGGIYTEYPCPEGQIVLAKDNNQNDRCGEVDTNLAKKCKWEGKDVTVGDKIVDAKATEFIVSSCNGDGTAIVLFWGDSESTKNQELKSKGKCTPNPPPAIKSSLCDINYYFQNDGITCLNTRTFAENCKSIYKDSKDQPVSNITEIGPGGKRIYPNNLNGDYTSIKPIDVKTYVGKDPKVSFDTRKITKTCGGKQFPDTDQNEGKLIYNEIDLSVYKCIGKENGNGTLVPMGTEKSLGKISIGIVLDLGSGSKLPVCGSGVSCGNKNGKRVDGPTECIDSESKVIKYCCPSGKDFVDGPQSIMCGTKPALNRKYFSSTNAEAVLGVNSNNVIELDSTGTYTITSGNTSVKEFKVIDLVNGKAQILFFNDKNANGIKDEGEEDIDTPLEVKIEKTSDLSRIDLVEGWNLIGYEYSTSMSAKELLKNISSQGGYATHVAAYRQGGWIMYSERGEKSFGNDFNLIPGEGYFVKVIKKTKISFEGKRIEPNQPYRLSSGWNLLSFRLDPILKASKLIDGINLNPPVSSDVVTRFVNGKYENVVKDKDTIYGNDFDIEENKGYFVRVSKGGLVIKLTK